MASTASWFTCGRWLTSSCGLAEAQRGHPGCLRRPVGRLYLLACEGLCSVLLCCAICPLLLALRIHSATGQCVAQLHTTHMICPLGASLDHAQIMMIWGHRGTSTIRPVQSFASYAHNARKTVAILSGCRFAQRWVAKGCSCFGTLRQGVCQGVQRPRYGESK
jgi:hypothetical protein